MGPNDQILEDDKAVSAKQRHTSQRSFERLRDEHGYAGEVSRALGLQARYYNLIRRKPNQIGGSVSVTKTLPDRDQMPRRSWPIDRTTRLTPLLMGWNRAMRSQGTLGAS
jgi:hypothetical protein